MRMNWTEFSTSCQFSSQIMFQEALLINISNQSSISSAIWWSITPPDTYSTSSSNSNHITSPLILMHLLNDVQEPNNLLMTLERSGFRFENIGQILGKSRQSVGLMRLFDHLISGRKEERKKKKKCLNKFIFPFTRSVLLSRSHW